MPRSYNYTLTPEERSRIARENRLRGHAMGATNTAPATKAFLARFEREADPDGTLAPEERAQTAEALRRAYFRELGRRGGKASGARGRPAQELQDGADAEASQVS